MITRWIRRGFAATAVAIASMSSIASIASPSVAAEPAPPAASVADDDRGAPPAMPGGSSCGSEGSCFEPDLYAPGCEDVDCCTAVCNVEAICCSVAWDKFCVALAEKICDNCGSGSNSCFEVSPAPSCNDVAICQAVCEVDPTCCTTAWDQDCVRKATQLCAFCGSSCAGSCLVAHPDHPGCNDAECCSAVCLFDPRCCDVSWDGACVAIAETVCTGCGTPGTGSCCYESLDPYCSDAECCEQICSIDPSCCNQRWDRQCAEQATNLCGLVTCRCGVQPLPGQDLNCKSIHPQPGCQDFECCNDVCAIDGFCCAVSWDAACVKTADRRCAFTPGCGVPGSGSCFVPHATAGCDDAGCCDRVCRVPGFEYCCQTGWDEDCVRAAVEFCDQCGDAQTGSCFVQHGSPNCNNVDCCEAVCDVDSFCCNVGWDGVCVAIAVSECEPAIASCGSNQTRPCLVPGGVGGCSDGSCCTLVCSSVDPFCCEVRWDSICVAQAASLCPDLLLANHGRGPCLEVHPIFGCSNQVCASAVCDVLPDCCLLGWDARCVAAAEAICVDPDSGSGIGPCDAAHATSGCNDPSCESIVCFLDPSCCLDAWDPACVSLANFNCNPIGAWECPCEGSCLEAKQSPGCRDASCCSGVCRVDPSCCEVAWDEECVTLARVLCCGASGCGNPCAGPCLLPHDGPNCEDRYCCAAVCEIDPSCCAQRWDAVCAEIARDRCVGGCGLASSGSCYVAHDTPGCDDPACCALICDPANDTFCCDVAWDASCVEMALKMCDVPACGDFLAGDCCSANGTPNCRDADCCEAVCEIDPVCCDAGWDSVCVDIARDETACDECRLDCGDPCAGDCCSANFTPFCNDESCCEAVCQSDPFCCDGSWDDFCASIARSLGNPGGPCDDACPVPPCGDPAAGGCCKPNGTPNCSDEECCEAVCLIDPFCCNEAWDLNCALIAGDECKLCGAGLSCGDPDSGPCDEPHPEPYCDDDKCCEFVCILDATCCSVGWDADCVALADFFCSP